MVLMTGGFLGYTYIYYIKHLLYTIHYRFFSLLYPIKVLTNIKFQNWFTTVVIYKDQVWRMDNGHEESVGLLVSKRGKIHSPQN